MFKDLVNTIWCGIPFVGLLLSISTLPLIIGETFHKYRNHIIAFWVSTLLLPLMFKLNPATVLHEVGGSLAHHYVPFVVLISCLYMLASGIIIKLPLKATPLGNIIYVSIAMITAGFIGTTGASILFIRQLIKMNINHKRIAHLVVAFIILVSNVGGGLTPLGDPPLFLGFLEGVTFSWTFLHMALPVALVGVWVLSIVFIIDWFSQKGEKQNYQKPKFKMEGILNLVLLKLTVMVVFASGVKSCDWLNNKILFLHIRDIILIGFILLSVVLSDKKVQKHNDFSIKPIEEVAIVFLGIFITLIPYDYLLGEGGALREFVASVGSDPKKYFWISGFLSAVLDNAPTYMVFFKLTGKTAVELMGEHSNLLLAISMATVFMGSLTYIGNAPNMLVRSIAESYKIAMPNFWLYLFSVLAVMIAPLWLLSKIFL